MNISYEYFKELDIRVGKIVSAEPVPDTDKLMRLMLDTGEGEERQVIAGIAESYDVDALVGRMIPVIVNLEPRAMRGYTSNGMILAATLDDDSAVLLSPINDVKPGSSVK